MTKTHTWMVLEDAYQISLELWLSANKEYFLVALGGVEEDRDRLVSLGGKRQLLFPDRASGNVKAVVFPPSSGKISTQQWLSQFPKAHTEERAVAEYFRVRPGADGKFSDEVVRQISERAGYWTEKAREAKAQREALQASLDSIPFFDEPVEAVADEAPVLAPAGEARPIPPAPDLTPNAEEPAITAQAQAPAESPQAEALQEATPTASEASAEMEAEAAPAAVEAPAEAPAPAPAAPDAPRPSSPGVIAEFLNIIHEGDDRPILRLSHDGMSISDEKVDELLSEGASALLMRSRGLGVPAKLIERMPKDLQASLMLLGSADNLASDAFKMLQSGAWPIVGGAWGKPVRGMDRLVLFLDGTLPPPARLTDLKSLPKAESEAAMAAVINELWRTTYGQVGQVVQAAAAVQEPGSAPHLGAGAPAGGVQGIPQPPVLAGMEGHGGAGPGQQAADGTGPGRVEGAGSVRTGGAGVDAGRAGGDTRGSDAGAPGVGTVQPGAAAGVADRDDPQLPGGDAGQRHGDGGEAGGGRRGNRAADGAERQGARRDGAGRAGDASDRGADLVAPATGSEAGEEAQAEPEIVEAEAEPEIVEAEALSDEDAQAIAARMAERRRVRTARLMSAESDDSRQDYVPASALAAQGVKIPVNLASATSRALARVQAEYGDIDQFVAAQLGFARAQELEGRLYAEQVDAIALVLNAIGRGREAVVGDLTGIGKGRVLASMIRYAERQETPVIFVTKDITLFNSMAREMAVMGCDHLLDARRMLITNSNGVIVNEQGDTILKAPTATRMREVWASGTLPEGVRVIFTTHSQLSEVAKGMTAAGWVAEQANRTGWLRRVAEGALILSDESHLSAGVDSTCGENLRAMLAVARTAVHSSATSAKEPKNLALYAGTDLRLLGNRTDLENLLRKGGAAAMEAIPAMLAEEGQYIRREHNMGSAEFVYPEVSAEVSQTLRGQMDAVSSALRLLLRLQSVISRMNAAANAHEAFNPVAGGGGVGRRLGLSSQHFASPLHHFTSQSLFALHADFYADQAIEALRRGEKPVFLVKDTLGSVVDEIARSLIDEGVTPHGAEFEMTFAEVLERIARRMTTINVNLGPRRQFDLNLLDPLSNAPRPIRSSSYRAIAELMRNTQAEVQEMMAAFREALQGIPAAIPLSPLDRLRQRLEEAGYSMGELTGRSRRLTEVRPGVYRMEDRENAGVRNRQAIMNAFNSGELEAILINRAGATGVDLHSDLRFADQRRRNMIVCQADDDIYVFQQAMGRVFRANQANFPTYTFPGSAIPVAVRGMSIMRRRLSSMLALTRGSRESEVGEGMPDIFNWVGSEAALNYLRNNPVIAETLGINLAAEEQRAWDHGVGSDTNLANRLTALALLLPCEAQEDLIDGLVREYEQRLEDLERRGINPFRSRHMDLKARVVNEMVLHPATGPSVFQASVVLKELEYGVAIPPLRETGIQALLNLGKEALSLRGGASRNWTNYPLTVVMQRLEMNVRERQASSFDLFLRSQYPSIEAARESEHDTVISRLERHLKMFQSVAPHLGLGESVELLLGSAEPVTFHIVEITPPMRDQDLHSPSDWRLRLISPVAHVREVDVPLSTVFADAIEIQQMRLREADPEAPEAPKADLAALDRFIFKRGAPNLLLENGRGLNPEAVRLYEEAPSGEVRHSRYVLGGNLLRAIAIASESHKGLPATYTLADGSREHGVVMPANFDSVRLMTSQVELRAPEDLLAYLQRMGDRSSTLMLPLTLGPSRVDGITVPAKEIEADRVNFWLTVRANPRDGVREVTLVAPRAKNRSGWLVGYQPLMDLCGAQWAKSGADVSLKVLVLRGNDDAALAQTNALMGLLEPLGVTVMSPKADRQARRWLCELYQERAAGGRLPEQAVCAREM